MLGGRVSGYITEQDSPLLFPLPVLDGVLVGVLLRFLSGGSALHVFQKYRDKRDVIPR